MDHKSEDSHHGGTSLVQLDSALGELGVGIKGVPAVVDEAVTEVTNEFSSGDVLHDEDLKESDESEELEKGSRGKAGDGVETGRNVRELGSREVNGSRKTDSGLFDEVSNDGKHGNTSVLDLNVSETVEVFLVSIGDKSEGVEEAKRRLGSEFILEGLQGGGLGGLLGRSEGGGSGDEGGKDGELHVSDWIRKYEDENSSSPQNFLVQIHVAVSSLQRELGIRNHLFISHAFHKMHM